MANFKGMPDVMADRDLISFYADLKAFSGPLPDLLVNSHNFVPIPDSWHVIITDIISSTPAVSGGRHQEVNLIATGSIVAVLNIALARGIPVPFFFGGDGATFLIPDVLKSELMEALQAYQRRTFDNFGLELRTGIVGVSEVYGKGHRIGLAKFNASPTFSIPVVLGDGLSAAEAVIKGDDFLLSGKSEPDDLDLSGMQCRWDQIAPPANKEEIVTLLIISVDVTQQAAVFAKVMREIDRLYGSPESRQPISVPKLRLKTTFTRFKTEMRAQIGKIRWLAMLRNWMVSFYGFFWFRTGKGQDYLKDLVEKSDTLVLDGKINTVISGTSAQREKLQSVLDKWENEGLILYGLHTSNAAVMSCYVRNLKDEHVHFVDGSGGGYTAAARLLKAKIRA